MMLADDFDGRVQVVNNQRISVTQRRSVVDAIHLAEKGMDAVQIREFLEKDKFNSSIYIMVDTLYYLEKGRTHYPRRGSARDASAPEAGAPDSGRKTGRLCQGKNYGVRQADHAECRDQ